MITNTNNTDMSKIPSLIFEVSKSNLKYMGTELMMSAVLKYEYFIKTAHHAPVFKYIQMIIGESSCIAVYIQTISNETLLVLRLIKLKNKHSKIFQFHVCFLE